MTSTFSLSQVERDEIREVFELFDVENKGRIDAKEVEQVMESLQLDAQILKPFREALSKYKGKDQLDLESFQNLVLSKRNKNNDWRSVFDLFDVEKKGYITKKNLEHVAETLGETMSKEEVEEMIDRANVNKDGKVTFQEFEAIMAKNLFSTSSS